MYKPNPSQVTDGNYDDPDEAVFDEVTCEDCTEADRSKCPQCKYNIEHYGVDNAGHGCM